MQPAMFVNLESHVHAGGQAGRGSVMMQWGTLAANGIRRSHLQTWGGGERGEALLKLPNSLKLASVAS